METDSRIINNNMLLIIPSWSQLLGNPVLGKYNDKNVGKILEDPVIFFGGMESTIKTKQETLHFLFGLGHYGVKFELLADSVSVPFSDSRELTGLILSDFVYDYMTTSENITLQNDREIIVTERVIKIPVSTDKIPTSKKNFISDTIMRNVFTPNKNLILELVNNIQNTQNVESPGYQFQKFGHILLSSNSTFFNQILLSDQIKGKPYGEFAKSIPGITDVIFKADNYLQQHFSAHEINQIGKNIRFLKRIYSSLAYDPYYLYSIVENASYGLESFVSRYISKQTPKGGHLDDSEIRKESVFVSAETRINEIVKWPKGFKRRTKKELESLAGIGEYKSLLISKDNSELNKTVDDENGDTEEEEYELRALKNKVVETKSLPRAPKGNISEILYYIKYVIEEDYEMVAIGRAFEIARDNIRKVTLHTPHMGDLGNLANFLKRKEPHLALNRKEKRDMLKKVNRWINDDEKSEK
ncbi:MAG: hypothetical protein ACTSWY_12630 [Promethearchaeota archaeon]